MPMVILDFVTPGSAAEAGLIEPAIPNAVIEATAIARVTKDLPTWIPPLQTRHPHAAGAT